MSVPTQMLENLRAVQSGRRSRAPGIGRCPDCTVVFIRDSSVRWCPTCRVGHVLPCTGCGVRIPIAEDGSRVCPSCQGQLPLFGEVPA